MKDNDTAVKTVADDNFYEESCDDDSHEKYAYADFTDTWPILFQRAHSSAHDAFLGISCGAGWKFPLQRLCDKLEAINLTFGKTYGFAICAAQVKEKFGVLHFYFDVKQHISFTRRILSAPFMWLCPPDIHATGFQKKVSDALSSFFYGIGAFIRHGSNKRRSQFLTVSSAVFDIANALISKCTDECYNKCEECGQTIGEDTHYPRCETLGWVTYICEDCAKKHNTVYFKYADGKARYFKGDKDVSDEYLKTKAHVSPANDLA